MRRFLSASSFALAACLLLAPASGWAQEKKTVVYEVDGQQYTSLDAAYAALKAGYDREVALLPKADNHVSGKLLAVMAPYEQILKLAAASSSQPEQAAGIAMQLELASRANLDALAKQALFDGIDIQVSDHPQSLPTQGYDYMLSLQPTDDGKHLAWRMVKTSSPGRLAILGNDGGPTPQRLRAFVTRVANVADKLNQAGGPQIIPGQAAPQPQVHGVMTGTIFFIEASGLALTNAHVVNGCQSLKVALPDGETEAKLVEADASNDLALIKVPGRKGPLAHFRAPPPVRQGEDVVVYGFPMAGSLSTQGNLTTGIVSALTGLKDDSRYLQITAPVQHGNSGGPVLDGSGHVLGVVASRLNSDQPGQQAQNVNFAIKSQIALNFLDTNGVAYDTAASKGRQATADIGDMARGFTAMVKCQK